MALVTLDYKSEVLSMSMTLKLLYPEKALYTAEVEDIPVLYLLHGMSGDVDTWMRRTSIERYVKDTNLAVVFLDTHDGWYSNTHSGYRYFDAFTQEVPELQKSDPQRLLASRSNL